jgi:hypothetical protein
VAAILLLRGQIAEPQSEDRKILIELAGILTNNLASGFGFEDELFMYLVLMVAKSSTRNVEL